MLPESEDWLSETSHPVSQSPVTMASATLVVPVRIFDPSVSGDTLAGSYLGDKERSFPVPGRGKWRNH